MSKSSLLQLANDVQSAVASGRAVVALESTVIAHGLPRPHNLETAQRCEQIVRECGALPATIAILQGKLHVGLSAEQLQHIAQSDDVRKVSRRDLPIVVAREQDGATTVAATMWIASRAGIGVFATGGIGGVHRSRQSSVASSQTTPPANLTTDYWLLTAPLDVSADLPELARSNMIVVCSGAKIILDLPATREWLETNGVTVIGYGCDELPAFYSRASGLPVDARADTPDEIVKIAKARRELDMAGALLVTVPVPAEAEVPTDQLRATLDRALADAARDHIGGHALTPFLLSRMAEHSGGATLRANIALLENNARVAAQIAQALVTKKSALGFVR